VALFPDFFFAPKVEMRRGLFAVVALRASRRRDESFFSILSAQS
jgi:hypothetical protein